MSVDRNNMMLALRPQAVSQEWLRWIASHLVARASPQLPLQSVSDRQVDLNRQELQAVLQQPRRLLLLSEMLDHLARLVIATNNLKPGLPSELIVNQM